jgi:hypothetical protein
MITIKYVAYSEIADLEPEKKVKKLIEFVKGGKIILLQGTLSQEEEALLIERTMKVVTDKFKGIEIAAINKEMLDQDSFVDRIKGKLVNMLLGNRQGLTIIGDATLVKEIRQDPTKIELLTTDPSTFKQAKTIKRVTKKKSSSKKK